MTDATRIATLEAQLEVVAADRDSAREMLREMGRENAKLRAALNLHREALADHRREFARFRDALADAHVALGDAHYWFKRAAGSPHGDYAMETRMSEAMRAVWIARQPALSEEEGTPADDLNDSMERGEVRGFDRAVKMCAEIVWNWPDKPNLTYIARAIEALSPSPATPSEGRCCDCDGTGTFTETHHCGRCQGSGRATPRGQG